MTVQHEAARPKRADDAFADDAPVQSSMRSFPPKTIRRAPSADQKRVRREMLRGKTAAGFPCEDCRQGEHERCNGLATQPFEFDEPTNDNGIACSCTHDTQKTGVAGQTYPAMACDNPEPHKSHIHVADVEGSRRKAYACSGISEPQGKTAVGQPLTCENCDPGGDHNCTGDVFGDGEYICECPEWKKHDAAHKADKERHGVSVQANVDYCAECGLKFDPVEGRDRSEHDGNICAECAGENLPDADGGVKPKKVAAQQSGNYPNSLQSSILGMKSGETATYTTGDHKHEVHYREEVPNGDNGQPARGYKGGDYFVDQKCCGGKDWTDVHHVSPFKPHESSQKAYAARSVTEQIVGHTRRKSGMVWDPRTASLREFEATAFDSTAERLNPGDHVRTPTGQTQKVLRVRPHENSSKHVYVDTDQGTFVSERKSPYQIVPHNSQQQELPGYGRPGGNSNKTPFGRDPKGSNMPGNDTKCPVCQNKGTIRQRGGDHYECTRCGYQERFGGAGGTSTTSPSVVRNFSTVNKTQSAIARRASQVVLDSEEQK